MAIAVKNPEAIEKMRRACRIVALVHKTMEQEIRPGISTAYLDRVAEEVIRSEKATPSFKGYRGFPGAICASVDDEVITAFPARKGILHEGSIISIDVGAYIDGYHGDGARTFPVGVISDEARALIEGTRESFFEGMKYAKDGNHLHEISAAIQKKAESYGYGVVREFVGHGVGKKLHEDPSIPNFKPIGRGPRLVAGMTLAVEPMINAGRPEVRVLEDDWTTVTRDGSLSAHYENTILITKTGYEILTKL